jgi:hypothetical protein
LPWEEAAKSQSPKKWDSEIIDRSVMYVLPTLDTEAEELQRADVAFVVYIHS